MRAILTLLLTFLCVVEVEASTSKATLVYPGSVFAGFGKPADDLKEVTVSGDVLHSGTYYLPKGASLYDLLMRLGECSGKAEFSPPRDVVLTIMGKDGEPERQTLRIFGVAPKELKEVGLAPGIRCYFPLRIL